MLRCRVLVAIILSAVTLGGCGRPQTLGVVECASDSPIVVSPNCEDFAALAFGAAFYTCVGFDEDCPAPSEAARRTAEQEAMDNCTAACKAKRCRADRELPCRAEELPLKERTRKVIDFDCVDNSEDPIDCQVVKVGTCTCTCKT